MPYTPLPFGGQPSPSGSSSGGYVPLPFQPGGYAGAIGMAAPSLSPMAPGTFGGSGMGGFGYGSGNSGGGAMPGMLGRAGYNSELMAGDGLTWRDIPGVIGAVGAGMSGPLGIPMLLANNYAGQWGPLGKAASAALGGASGGLAGVIGSGIDSLGNSALGWLQDGRQGGFWDFLLGSNQGANLPYATAPQPWMGPAVGPDYGSSKATPQELQENWDRVQGRNAFMNRWNSDSNIFQGGGRIFDLMNDGIFNRYSQIGGDGWMNAGDIIRNTY